jgi:Asp-tRNA(Asn)/Glu-tRNA(Gln) amidotransferase A subunit family amidase
MRWLDSTRVIPGLLLLWLPESQQEVVMQLNWKQIEIPNLVETLAFTATYLSRSRSDLDGFFASTKPPLNTTCEEIHASKKYDERLDLFAGLAKGPKVPSEDPHYLQRLEDREAFQMLVVGIMAKHNISAIVFPDTKIPAPLHSDITNWTAMEFPTNTLLGSQTRLPAITVPAGFTESGLPVGLEILGLPYAEQTLLEMAYGVEHLIRARKAPSLG